MPEALRNSERNSKTLAWRIFKPALAGVAAIFVSAAVYTSHLIAERQDALKQTSRYNVAWVASQAVSELLKLEQRIAASGVPGSDVDQDEVQLRVDILFNRVSVLAGPDVRDLALLNPEVSTVIADLDLVLHRVQPMIPLLEAPETSRTMLALLTPFEQRLARLAAAANVRGGDLVAEDQRQLSQLHWFFSGAMVILAACGLGLFILLLLRNNLLRQVHRQLLDRSHQLDTQNGRFDAALNNMSQALCMVDADGRLIVCNHRFLELFELTQQIANARAPIQTVLQAVMKKGGPRAALAREIYARQEILIRTREAADFFCEHSSGQALAVFHRPMGAGWIATYEDITERRQTEAKIAYLAHYDPLTGLLNRVLFRERLEHSLAVLVRSDQPLAVLCLDLDSFKEVNDTLGHPAGDTLLKEVSQRLRLCVGSDGEVARLSGDEFAILYPSMGDVERVRILAQQLISEVAKPVEIDGQNLVVGLSIGVSLSPLDAIDADDLLKKADIALYRTKSAGGRDVRFFEQNMQAQLEARRAIQAELRGAIERRELELYYQPIFSLSDRSIVGFEALLRWHHPERGMVSPVDFIPVAEETGLIIEIGDWVIQQACADAARWPSSVRVAVNLSVLQFEKTNLLQVVRDALRSSGLPARRLELEITESVLLKEDEATIQTLHQLKALGLRIALDDFGTGYASLSYLRSFPFDQIKIDRSFVQDLGVRADGASIVNAVAELAQKLGMETTAEGVETSEQLRLLQEAGCTQAQGFNFGRPSPASQVMHYFADVMQR
jgi:diguanylate cyclase (GGDEF)-like protein